MSGCNFTEMFSKGIPKKNVLFIDLFLIPLRSSSPGLEPALEGNVRDLGQYLSGLGISRVQRKSPRTESLLPLPASSAPPLCPRSPFRREFDRVLYFRKLLLSFPPPCLSRAVSSKPTL